MWLRFQDCLTHRASLTATAYLCVTLLEHRAGGRKKATQRYGISKEVFGTLAHLATEIGDVRTVRKITRQPLRSHTKGELRWMEATLKAIIRRAGEVAAGSRNLPRIKLTDLPQL